MKKSLRITFLLLTLTTGLFAQVKLGQKLKEAKQAATKRLSFNGTFNYDSTDNVGYLS
jgi:hypothetical protein